MVSKSTLAIFLFAFVLHLNAQTVDQVLTRYFNQVGTASAWGAVTTRVDYYTVTNVSNMSNPASLNYNTFRTEQGISFFKRKGKEAWNRFVSIPENSVDTFSTCYNGKQYWMQHRNTEPTDLSEFAQAYKHYVQCGEPYFILKADTIIYSGKDSNWEILRVRANNETFVYYFDRDGLLRKSHPLGKNTITFYKEYQRVGMFQVPFIEETLKDNSLVCRVERQKVVFNEKIPDNIFDFPQKPFYILSCKF
jgi:hypothetical protein